MVSDGIDDDESIISESRDSVIGKVQEIMNIRSNRRFFIKRTMYQGEMNVGSVKERLGFLMKTKSNTIDLVSLCRVREEQRFCSSPFYDFKIEAFGDDLRSINDYRKG